MRIISEENIHEEITYIYIYALFEARYNENNLRGEILELIKNNYLNSSY